MNALGMYIFAGGFTLGVRKHFNVIVHLEGNNYGVASMRRNQPDIPVFDNPDTWPTEDIHDEFGGQIDFLYGNPPCAAWSPIGRVIQVGSSTEQWREDPRVDCVRTQLNALEFFQPTVWAWESVPQAYTRGWSLVKHVTQRAWQLGYRAYYVLHNSQYIYGRQHRKRFFCVLSKVDIDWRCPFVDPIPLRDVLKEFRKIPKAKKVEGTPKTNVKQRMYDECKPGEALRCAWDRLPKKEQQKQQKQGFAVKRSNMDTVSPAIIGPRILHPTECRHFTTAECLYICGYPTDYQLSSGPAQQVHEIARAVMPPVGEWLAFNVKRAVQRWRQEESEKATEVNFYDPPGFTRDRTKEIE